MPSPISVKIELPAWMKKYLIFQSDSGSEPIHFHRKHKFNRLLVNLISNYRNITGIDFAKKDVNPEYNNSVVNIKLPFNKYKDVYFYNNISVHNKEVFRREIKQEFLFQYHTFIRKKIKNGIDRKTATENFLKLMNIDEDELKYESLYRKFTRYMNKAKLIV